MIVFLIGFMGCGKSKKGKKAAGYLGLEFIDMDEWIEKAEQMSISELFKFKGEDYFRRVEYTALLEISQMQNVLVATGGGSPCFFDSMELMNAKGLTLYLKASPAFLRERLLQSKKKRPLIENLSENELLSYIENKLIEREPFYSQAKFCVEALSCRAKELAEAIRTAAKST